MQIKNKVRYPFTETPLTNLISAKKKNKRTQRYRSTAKSRICGMTVGDIRYCFQQLRQANADLSPDFILYNGQCAGEFALSYLIETSNSMKKKRQQLELQSPDAAAAVTTAAESDDDDDDDDVSSMKNDRYHLPASQLLLVCEKSTNVVKFL